MGAKHFKTINIQDLSTGDHLESEDYSKDFFNFQKNVLGRFKKFNHTDVQFNLKKGLQYAKFPAFDQGHIIEFKVAGNRGFIHFPKTQLASLWETVLNTPVKTPMAEGSLTPLKIKHSHSVLELFTTGLEEMLKGKVCFAGVYPTKELFRPIEKFYTFHGDLQLGELAMSLTFFTSKFPIHNSYGRSAYGSSSKRLTNLLGSMELEVTAVIGSCLITVDDLTKLSIGDIIVLDEPCDEPLKINIGGVTKFRGMSGIMKGQVCCQISEVPEAEDRPPFRRK